MKIDDLLNIDYFNENCDNIELPKDGEYVDGSFRLSESDPDFIKLFQ